MIHFPPNASFYYKVFQEYFQNFASTNLEIAVGEGGSNVPEGVVALLREARLVDRVLDEASLDTETVISKINSTTVNINDDDDNNNHNNNNNNNKETTSSINFF